MTRRTSAMLGLAGSVWALTVGAQGPLTLAPPPGRADVPSCALGKRHDAAHYGQDFQCLYGALTAAFVHDLRDVPLSWLKEHARQAAELARRASVIARTPSFPHVVAARLQTMQLTMGELEPTHARSICALAKAELETACIDDLCSAPTLRPTSSQLHEALSVYAAACADRVQCSDVVRVSGQECHEGWRLARARMNDVFAAQAASLELGPRPDVKAWSEQVEQLENTTRDFIKSGSSGEQLGRLDTRVVELGSRAALGLSIEKARRDEEALRVAQVAVKKSQAELLAEKVAMDRGESGAQQEVTSAELAARRSEVSRELARLDHTQKEIDLKLTETVATHRQLQQISPATKSNKSYRSAIDGLVNLNELDANSLVERIESAK